MSCSDDCHKCKPVTIDSNTCDRLYAYNNTEIKPYLSIFKNIKDPCKLPVELGKFASRVHCFNDNQTRLLCNLKGRVDALETRTTNLENRMDKVETAIKDLEKQIEGILGLNFVELVKGRDYDITFYNGWSTQSGNVTVKVSTTTSSTSVNVTCAGGSNTALRNDNLKNTKFAHAASAGSAIWNDARIFKITFKDKYEPLNTGTKFGIDGNSLLNVKPTSSRASWSYFAGSAPLDGGQSFALISFADGYNDQFTRYSEALSSEESNFSYKWSTNKTIPTT